ncbi:NUDIX hydrolase domain-like protein [Stachybotrys elegans]|uniref:NUDIX hydrolase domain-like protein n=1 Tax=Stachybotrys elegans TaxID=80388 RepID=A0A8K0SL36_9HYPO|nr:NUDIX hydrolase domain-like protein [Stachybotrys elegans]
MASTTEHPAFVFKAHPSVDAFSVPPPVFLERHFPSPASASALRLPAPAFLATGAIVFDRPLPDDDDDDEASTSAAAQHAATATPPRVLLVQRAAHDSMPLRWETPGGGCDDDDVSILHSCARELFEEAGLQPITLGPLVRVGSVSDALGGQFFHTRRGKLVCKFYFVAGVPQERTADVVVDPEEHAGYVWATEHEVRHKKVRGLDLEFTTQAQWEVILTAFSLWHAQAPRAPTYTHP